MQIEVFFYYRNCNKFFHFAKDCKYQRKNKEKEDLMLYKIRKEISNFIFNTFDTKAFSKKIKHLDSGCTNFE